MLVQYFVDTRSIIVSRLFAITLQIIVNPPFNVDKVKSVTAAEAGRLPFGMPGINKNKEVSNANYLWISYFYAYLNESGRAGFVMASSATDSGNKDKPIREALVKTGHVDVMISVGNNFFYTKSLPCSLWFFDKGKPEHLKNTVLFIDARNYYTAVDRTLNEWSPWQMKNLNAIVWLYRGETEKYKQLLYEYHKDLHRKAALAHAEGIYQLISPSIPFQEIIDALNKYKEEQQRKAKIELEGALRFARKRTQAEWDERIAEIDALITEAKEGLWLTEKFGDGEWHDVPGLCKAATLQEIEDHGYSLTPGAYVGVAAQETDDVDFADRMKKIHAELKRLQAESNALMDTISRNWEEMGL